jgi:hypothetical protein
MYSLCDASLSTGTTLLLLKLRSTAHEKYVAESYDTLLLLWLYSPLLGIGHFFSFLILYTVGRTP